MQLGQIAQKIETAGVKTLGVVATDPARARLYFRYRRPRMPIGADPDLDTHRAFGLPNIGPPPPEALAVLDRHAARELGISGPVPADAYARFGRHDQYDVTAEDRADKERHGGQLLGQFLVDRDGVVRWVNVECAREGLEGLAKMASEDEVLQAVRVLAGGRA